MDRFDEIPPDRSLIVYCPSGYRSAIAISLLLRAGWPPVADLVGGMGAWEAARLETRAGTPAGGTPR
jgi:rhodanese-related sulfurtransferase